MTLTRCMLRRVTGAMVVATALLASPLAPAGQDKLAPATDLRADAKLVTSGVPLIVLVSLPGCPHCEVVRRSHLLPLLNDGTAAPKPLIRQVEMNGREILRDFGGRAITHGEFASRFKIRIAPVVMFFDASGEMIAVPLVGSMIPDFYGAYFDAALAEARSRLPATRP